MSNSLSKIIRTTADVMFLFITVFGFYIVLHGHLTPGGGFQGGAVIATGFILLIVAYKLDDFLGWFQKRIFQNCEMSGLVLFIGTALAAIPLGYLFFMNFLNGTGGLFGQTVNFGINPGFLNTAGTIPIMNVAVGIEVLGGLSIIILYMTSGIRSHEEGE
ncbi:Na(+)/H(+) antiporter subunit B [Methanospirillum hungatei]|jgi:energy-converting hydrogenase B subunit I|uniref:Na(+)/H(+) antiporter subunit B n=1 Tax=Methanospirillum hungatei TaxID=2203 RepID=UPI0009C48B7E|nr:Na(+)/H(+) antiporter subunit B [Methanospirillum hungatei]MBP7035025.1 Na(+)/H(+) antiporter subunit B [Methanospirillum sp.]MBP9008349.1 Na(+)/H(+) antiporter subunit B [Methanospirillum sp.]OQA59814.1 MAG: putative monovalent cation/H+ antiporter subunit B [Euryarchaeota archaeon ADurb.Bin294]HOW05550.1 Na(+)/H(+) antiporter subunit B [Methanospirillum hungatei]